jgi:multidrug efflux pump subunit AcrB
MRLQGIEGQSPQHMASVMCSLIYKANQLKEVSQVYSTYSASVPHIQIELDRARAQLMNLPVSEVFATLRTHLGSQYVNDFNILGRDYRVKVQDDSPFRDQPNRIDQHYIRSSGGGLVPLRTLVKFSTTLGPQLVNRCNLFPSVTINGTARPDAGSAQAIAAMQRLALEELPARV